MALNKQQLLGICLITGGLATITVACNANSNDKKFQEEDAELISKIKNTNGSAPKPNTIVSINSETGKVIKETQLPSGDNLNDSIAQKSQELSNANAKFNQYQQNNPQNFQTQNNYQQPNFQTVQTTTTNQVGKTCETNPEAMSVGIRHFKFPEASSSDLVSIGGRHQLHRDAVPSLRQMQADAKAQGVTLEIGSAFRSVAYQQGIVSRKKASGMSLHKIYHMSAPAGYSEHHTGFAVDFSPINSGFAKTKAFTWLKQNANKYGWYQTFTPTYSQNSGVSEESWHWKYLGSDTAKQMLANGNCI